jgi:hypothetical protein
MSSPSDDLHWPDGTPRTPVTACWHCDRPLDAASAVEGFAEPEEGAVSLCLYCGAIAMFGPDLILYPVTKEELDELAEDAAFRQTYVNFSWARQYVMIKDNLMRDRENPDR